MEPPVPSETVEIIGEATKYLVQGPRGFLTMMWNGTAFWSVSANDAIVSGHAWLKEDAARECMGIFHRQLGYDLMLVKVELHQHRDGLWRCVHQQGLPLEGGHG